MARNAKVTVSVKYVCPNGHEAETETYGAPYCPKCRLVATSYNARSGEVYEWTPEVKYRRDCQNLQDAMGEAFDNQYFGGGW